MSTPANRRRRPQRRDARQLADTFAKAQAKVAAESDSGEQAPPDAADTASPPPQAAVSSDAARIEPPEVARGPQSSDTSSGGSITDHTDQGAGTSLNNTDDKLRDTSRDKSADKPLEEQDGQNDRPAGSALSNPVGLDVTPAAPPTPSWTSSAAYGPVVSNPGDALPLGGMDPAYADTTYPTGIYISADLHEHVKRAARRSERRGEAQRQTEILLQAFEAMYGRIPQLVADDRARNQVTSPLFGTRARQVAKPPGTVARLQIRPTRKQYATLQAIARENGVHLAHLTRLVLAAYFAPGRKAATA